MCTIEAQKEDSHNRKTKTFKKVIAKNLPNLLKFR